MVRALKRKEDGISHACVDFLCALMQPMHDNYDLRQEQINKRSLLSSKGFLNLLLEPLKDHVVSGRGLAESCDIMGRCGYYVCVCFYRNTGQGH